MGGYRSGNMLTHTCICTVFGSLYCNVWTLLHACKHCHYSICNISNHSLSKHIYYVKLYTCIIQACKDTGILCKHNIYIPLILDEYIVFSNIKLCWVLVSLLYSLVYTCSCTLPPFDGQPYTVTLYTSILIQDKCPVL